MYFLIEDDVLLERENTVWDKVSSDIKKDFGSEPVYNKIIFKAKINSYCDEATDLHGKYMPKVDSNHTCLAVIILDSPL